MKKPHNSPFVTNVLALLNASAQAALTPTATHLYTALLAMQNRRGWTELLSMSDRMMAVATGLTARAVARGRTELQAASLIACRQTGTGSQSRWEYRLSAWRTPDAQSDAAALTNSSEDTSFKEKEKEENTQEKKKEEEDSRTLSLEELHGHMKANVHWRTHFSTGNGISEAELDEHIRLFLRMLSNTGVRAKTVADAYSHFGHWYNRRLAQHMQEKQKQQEAEKRRLDQLAEERRMKQLEKERKEQESWQTWLRIREEIIQRAAAGDPHAVRVMEQYKDVIYNSKKPEASDN